MTKRMLSTSKNMILHNLSIRAKANQQGAYRELLHLATTKGIRDQEILTAYAESGTAADFDARGDSIARGKSRKSPVTSTQMFPVWRHDLLANMSYLTGINEHEGYKIHLSEAQSRLIPDMEIYTAHSKHSSAASFNYLGELKEL